LASSNKGSYIKVMKISYAILTHNEGEYVNKLLSFLVNNKRPEDEIVVVDDHSGDKATVEYLNEYN
jgi:glycosyltransferase involved in cell wall biosynthesis